MDQFSHCRNTCYFSALHPIPNEENKVIILKKNLLKKISGEIMWFLSISLLAKDGQDVTTVYQHAYKSGNYESLRLMLENSDEKKKSVLSISLNMIKY